MFWPLDLLWLVTGAALAAVALLAVRPVQAGLGILLALLACVANAAFCYGIALMTPDLPGKLAWNRAEYATEVFIPAFLLMLVLDHVGQRERTSLGVWVALFLVPLLALLANWTNGYHHLYYHSVSLRPGGGIGYFDRERGPLFWVFHTYLVGTLALAAALLVQHARKTSRHRRWSSVALLVTVLLLLLMEMFHLSRLPFEQSAVMRFLGAAGLVLLVGWALLRWQLLDLAPLARAAVFEHMSEAFVVLDREGRVTDFNESAARWLGCTDAARGKLYRQLPALAQVELENGPAAVTLSGEQRFIRLGITAVCDHRGKSLGWLLLGRDDTRQHQAESALKRAYVECARRLQQTLAQSVRVQEEEQRRIGQELHDSLCQDLAGLSRSAESLAQSLEPTGFAALHNRAHELAQETGRILRVTRTLAHDLALTDLGFLSFESALESFSAHAEQWFGLAVELNVDEGVLIQDKETACHLLRIVREAVVNAARHGEARQIWVDVVRRDNQVSVTVSNDGRPLPHESERREGLGLCQMRMRAQLLGGTLSLSQQASGPVLLQVVFPEASLQVSAEERIAEAAPSLTGESNPYVIPPSP